MIKMGKAKLLLVDDHKVVRDGIKYTLELHGKLEVEIDEAESGSEAIRMAKLFKYDLIIMDITMPDVDGVEATTEITKQDKNIKILALSMHDEEYHIVRMMQAGAFGYMLKDGGSEEMIKAITTVLKGERFYSSAVAVKLMGNYHDDIVDRKPRSRQLYKGLLTKRELEVLNLIADELTNEEIAKKLFVSKRTIDAHRQNILNKTQVKNTAGLIRYMVKNNLV